jgi:hypothetical protein
VQVEHATFEEWWEPFTLGVAPSGSYVASLDPVRRDVLRERCRAMLPDPPIRVSAKAWAARGVASSIPDQRRRPKSMRPGKWS